MADSGQHPTAKPVFNATRLRQRLAMGFGIAGVAIVVITVGGWLWMAAILYAMWQAFQELARLVDAKSVQPSHTITIITGVVLVLLAQFGLTEFLAPAVAFGVIAGFIRLLFRQPQAGILDMGVTFLAIFYLGFLPMHYILLRNLGGPIVVSLGPIGLDVGGMAMMATAFVVAFTDVGAYFIGKLLGKTPLYPAVSPKKTVEGALGGILCGMAFGLLFLLTGMALWQAMVLSLLLGIGSQLGDLTESLMKRDAGLKDSGTLFQSHGGLLDRLDSYIFCGAIAYYFIIWVVRHQGVAAQLWSFG